MPLGESSKSFVRFDVIYQHDPADRHCTGHLFHLEKCIPGGVQAIVNEHLNLAGVFDHAWEAFSAGSLDVGPSGAARFRHRDTGLTVQAVVERERKVDAPEVAPVVLRQRFQHDPGGDAVRDTSLDDGGRPCVNGRAPRGTKKRPLGVAVPGVRIATAVQAMCRQQSPDVRHDAVQPLPVGARPRRTEQGVQTLLPGFVDLGGVVLLAVSPTLRDFARQRTDHDARIADHLTQCHRHLAKRRPSRFTPPCHISPPRAPYSQTQIISDQSVIVKLWSPK